MPVAAAVSAAPAYASSTKKIATGTVCRITRAIDGHFNNIVQHVYFGWTGTPGVQIPAQTSTTFTITIDQTVSSALNPGAPNITWGDYFTGSLTAATPVTPVTPGFQSTYAYTYTITSNQPLTPDSTGRVCGPYLTWDADNAVRPTSYQTSSSSNVYNNTEFTVTGASSSGTATSTVKWNVGGTAGGTIDNWWRPLAFVSSSGYSELPGVGFTAGVVAQAANYCTSNVPSTWNTTCVRCTQNSFTDLCSGSCDNYATCTAQNCTGTACR